VQYKILNNYIELTGDLPKLQGLYDRFSFKNKAIESQIRRFLISCRGRELTFPIGDDGQRILSDDWKRHKARQCAELNAKVNKSACHWTPNQSLMVPIGLIYELGEMLLLMEGSDHRDFDQNQRILKGEKPTLRTPQAEALEIVQAGARMGLIRMATGVGKTALGQEIIRHFGMKTLFVVPSERIFKQTIDRFEAAFGKKNVGAYGDGKKRHSFITVAIYNSVFNADPEEFKDYHLAIFDEVHHIGAETFYEVGLNRMPNLLYRFGLTADEERSDGGTILVHAAVGPLIYDYSAARGIEDGFLARPTFIMYGVTKTEGRFIEWKTDWETKKRENVGIMDSESYPGDDHHWAYKNWVLGNDLLTSTVAAMANEMASSGKSVLIMVDEKEHLEKFQKYLVGADYMWGGCPDSDEITAAFNSRKLKILCATSVIGEGADTIPVDALFNLMGGRRPKQVNGRALRNDPDENGNPRKPTTMIFDFYFPHSPVLKRHADEREVVHNCYVGKIHSKTVLI